jgi:uncharacterized protein YneF (UPF0154 family)
MFFVVGFGWLVLRIGELSLPIPVGLIIGLFFASHEHFRIDRKIEYAVLIVSMFVGYFLASRLVVQL